MRSVFLYLRRMIRKEQLEKPIGRWSRDYCEKKVSRKVELANEDHCGPCGTIVKEDKQKKTEYILIENDIVTLK